MKIKKVPHNRFKIFNLKEFVLIIFHNANTYFSGIFYLLSTVREIKA